MIIYLRGGEIIEQGTHEELLARAAPTTNSTDVRAWIHEVETHRHAEGQP